MDKIDKAIQKLTNKEKRWIKEVVKALRSGRFDNLDIKKLKGEDDIFRVRKGKVRIIYQIRYGQTFILKVGHRKEDTYKL
jgi:mRNA-degrading endonuclease RelE of RelBE toxin-antitoxin system